ncbi:hypothetical protein BGX24_002312 [Mortierella sp. AD032]|nr:hypothetical protein BGX24_002312 [Mortierella sp. AD032]
MFTKASTYLLNGNAIILTVALIAFIVSIAQRSVHLSGMEKEMNHAWTDAIRHRDGLISSFELRHECCGLNSLVDRPFPPLWGKDKGPLEPSDPRQPCSTNIAYGFQVPCRAELGKDFGRWQTRIQYLLLAEATMLLPLVLLVMTLSVIGNLRLKEKKREELDDAEAQAEAVGAVPAVVDGTGGATAQYGRNLLEDVPAHSGGTPFLINVEAEPVRATNNHRPVVQPTLI